MKKMIILVCLLTSSLTFATNRESGGMAGPSALYLNFISTEGSIDSRILERYENYISKEESQGRINVSTHESYGLEGEVLTCVLFKDVMVQRGFVKELMTWLSDAHGVELYVGGRCNAFDKAVKQKLTPTVNQ